MPDETLQVDVTSLVSSLFGAAAVPAAGRLGKKKQKTAADSRKRQKKKDQGARNDKRAQKESSREQKGGKKANKPKSDSMDDMLSNLFGKGKPSPAKKKATGKRKKRGGETNEAQGSKRQR
jgi:hypothetical protein